ncbi:dipeptidase PepE [Gillisia hiemivivida]|uniref:Dipeptidase PepE n=1 Tax=Gillisia hiemivivida TaxID=291190 RepID=A0A5C6ZVR8_9FLAO|nr:dipeptidase PepE [Gillisia hiemivivida]TXD93357.1 dipeptidase PepE [Gillisia hiemivivida]
MKNAILASTSTLHGQQYLAYLLPEIAKLFKNCDEIIFIPFARPGGITHEEYTSIAKKAFETISINVKGLHEFKDKEQALKEAKGIFTGGGNTFLLVDKLHRNNLMMPLREQILAGTPYLGSSAGTNIGGLTMQTTNDMPIIYPPSFKTLGIVPFNINPHYLDPDLNSKHKGETRETRIKEFHTINTQPVVGIREGSWLEIKGENITLRGSLSARIFTVGKEPKELVSNSNLSEII